MRYTVVWLLSALRDLAALWNNAPDRAAVTDAANAIDIALARDPLRRRFKTKSWPGSYSSCVFV
jgi:hypothetical protein